MLFSFSNVWNTCLLIIRKRGYRLYLLGDPDERGSTSKCTWNAEKDGMKFRADNPIELLGLIAIQEHHGASIDAPYWWRVDGPDIIGELEAAWRHLNDSERMA
jgi:hypothetical protein